jgi:sulfur carrier protein
MNTSSTIPISLDGARLELPPETSLAALLEQLGHAPAAVATAVNGSFVARAQRGQRVLQPGDAVLLFQPIVGG